MLATLVMDKQVEIREELLVDPEFAGINKYLLDAEENEGPGNPITANRAKHYEIVDDMLNYKQHLNLNGELRPVIPQSMRLEVLSDLQDLPVCGRMGIRKTFAGVREVVYLPNLKNWVSQYVRSCDTCQRINYINYRPTGFLNSVVANFLNDAVGVDLLGPYPRSTHGRHRFLRVIVNNFSKCVEIVPLKKASAESVSDPFLNKYVLKYGAPIKLIAESGSQLTSHIFTDLCHSLQIKHARMVTYRAQSNISERVNKNNVRMISAYIEHFHTQWDKHINEFTFALRAAKHDITKKKPAEIFQGREILTPLD